MAKFQVALFTLLGISGIVQAGIFATPAVRVQELDAYPAYNYGYSIQDPITGDVKNQEESRDGEVVRGRYSLIEPDGTLRIVNYYADSTGFHAVVDRQPGYAAPSPIFAHPAPVQVVQQQIVNPVAVQVPFRPLPQPPQQQPIQVVQPQPPQPQPQPVPVEIPQIPTPAPVEIPQAPPAQEIPQIPQEIPQVPQPTPPTQPQQPLPQPPQQPSFPQQPQPPQQQQPQETFDDAEVIEARRADSGVGSGSRVTFRSSRNGQHDFNFTF